MPNPIILEWKTDASEIRTTLEVLEHMGIVSKDLVDEAKKVEAAYAKQEQALQKTGQATDELRVDMTELVKSIRNVPDRIIEEQAVKVVNEAASAVEKTGKKTERMSRQQRALKEEMQKLEMQGKRNTKQWMDLAVQAAKMEDQIGDTAAQVKILASDTANIDGLVDGVTGLAGGFTAVQGAAALFGDENEDLQKSLLKVNGAMAITQGLQQIQLTLNKDSAFSIVVLGKAQAAYNAYLGASTGLLRAFRIALALTGIGAVIVAVTAIIWAFKEWNDQIKNVTVSIGGLEVKAKDYEKILDDTNEATFEQRTQLKLLLAVANDANQSMENRRKAIKAINELSPEYLGNLTMDKIGTDEARKAIDAYTASITRKAKAQAIESLLTDKYKELLEEQNQVILKTSAGGVLLDALLQGITGNNQMAARAQRQKDAVAGLNEEIAQLEALLTAEALKDPSFLFDDEAPKKLDRNIEKLEKFETIYDGIFAITKAMKDEEIRGGILREVLGGLDVPEADVDNLIKAPTDFYERLTKLQKDADDERKKNDQDDIAEWKAGWDERIGIAQLGLNTIADISSAFYNSEVVNLENQLKQNKITQEEYEQGIAEAKTRRAKQDKALAFFQTVIDTARGITAAIAESPLTFGLPWSAFMGAQGAIQAGLILAQPIPQYAEGTRSAASGWKLVGEEGPELIYDGGGYPVINHGDMIDLAAMLANYGISMPHSTDEQKKPRRGQEMQLVPALFVNIDENGFEKRIVNGVHSTISLDKRYSSRL